MGAAMFLMLCTTPASDSASAALRSVAWVQRRSMGRAVMLCGRHTGSTMVP